MVSDRSKRLFHLVGVIFFVLGIGIGLGAGASAEAIAETDPDWVPWGALKLTPDDDAAFREFAVYPKIEAEYLDSAANWIRIVRAEPTSENRTELCFNYLTQPLEQARSYERSVMGHSANFEQVYTRELVAKILAATRSLHRELTPIVANKEGCVRSNELVMPGLANLFKKVIRFRNQFNSLHEEMAKTARSLYDQKYARSAVRRTASHR